MLNGVHHIIHVFLKREKSLLFHILTSEVWLDSHLSLSLSISPLSSLFSFAFNPLSEVLTFSLSVSLYLFWSVSFSKVTASCMDPDSAMVTARIKPSVKIIIAPCWWASQCDFHSGGIPGVPPLLWKCLIIAASQSVIAFSSVLYFPEARWFIAVVLASYVCVEWSCSHMSEWVHKQVFTRLAYVCASTPRGS